MRFRSRRTPTRSQKRSARRWPEILLGAALLSSHALAFGQDHDPSDAAVPWTGSPAPIEGRTTAGALSPHGSHVGLKGLLDPDPEVVAAGLGAVALHDARASASGRLAAAAWVVESGGSALAPADVAVRFEPWGWSVDGSLGALQARARAFFVAEDAVVLTLRLQTTEVGGTDVVVRLDVASDGAATPDGGDVLIAAGDATLALGGPDALALRAAGPPAVLVVDEATIGARDEASFTLMLGFGATADEARRARDRGWAAFASRDAEAAWREQEALFDEVEAAAACSDLEGADAEGAHRLAVAALWSSAYAPRGAITRTLLSAAKSLDNAFVGSDLPAQARAVATWDPALALQALLGQVDALAPDSHVPYRFDDELARQPLPNGSMPPVQAQAFGEVLRWGADLAPDDRDRVVRRLAAVAAWWPTNRDYLHEGLLVHGSPEEAGRPGSRRWPVVDGESEAAYFEAPDLTATYAEFLVALADLAGDLADADPGTWRARALEIGDRIDDDLWDDDLGVWVDRDTRSGERSLVTGAHGLLPLALGMTTDEERIRRVIDELLLRPDGLWGDDDGPRLAVPTIAYDVDDGGLDARESNLEDAALALRVLSRFGRRAEAERLEQRVLSLVARRAEGVYDRYLTGEAPDAEPARLQTGGAGAALLGILHRDHERERTIAAEETRIEGKIAVARFLEGGARLVDLGDAVRLPRLVLESIEPADPLEARGMLRITLQATCDVADGDALEVALPALGPYRWTAQDGSGSGRSNGSFSAQVGRSYTIEPLRLRGGGCACRAAGAGGSAPLASAGAALLALSLRRRRR